MASNHTAPQVNIKTTSWHHSYKPVYKKSSGESSDESSSEETSEEKRSFSGKTACTIPTVLPEVSKTIVIVDFLNMVRKEISGRPDAKFTTVDDFIDTIMKVARQVHSFGNFQKIYLVTKSFKFSEEITYNNVPLIIIWSFCKAVPEWREKLFLVLVNGINDKDREADDRALFILYNEILKSTTMNVFIISNDKFRSLDTHFLRKVILNFYVAKTLAESWNNSVIVSRFGGIFQQNENLGKSSYSVIHPCEKEYSSINVCTIPH